MYHAVGRQGLLALLLLTAAACSGDDPAAVQRDLARIAALTPADAVAHARITSLDALQAQLREIVGALEPGAVDEVDVDAMLGRIGPFAGDVDLVDRRRPLGFAVSMAGGVPAPVLIVPVANPDAYAATLPGEPAAIDAEGGYVVVAPRVAAAGGADYEPPASAPAITADMPAGVLAIRADVVRLVTPVRPLIEGALVQAERMIDKGATTAPAGFDVGAIIGMYFDIARTILDSTETLEAGVAVDGGVLDASIVLRAAAGSAMDGWGSTATVDLAELASRLDDDASLSVIARADFAALMDRLEPFNDALVEAHPEGMRGLMASWLDGFAAVYGKLGRGFAFNGRFGAADGLRATIHLRPEDPEALADSYEEIVASTPLDRLGMQMAAPVTSEADGGVSVRDYRLQVDVDKLMASLVENAEEAAVDETRAALRSLLGDDGMPLRFASRDRRAVLVLGGDQDYRDAALARLTATAAASDDLVQRALERVGDANPCVIYRVDFARILADMVANARRNGARAHGPGVDPAASANMLFFGGVRDREWRAGIQMDVAGFGAMMRPARER